MAELRARLFSRIRGSELDGAFRLLFDAAPDGKALLDPSGTIVAANPSLAVMAGPAVALRAGMPAAALIASADRPALAWRIGMAAGRGPLDAEPLLAKPADPKAPGDTCWALQCRPLAIPEGYLLLTVADRTEQSRNAARSAANSRLETVGRLAGGVAHDFNNLLTAVFGAAGALRTGELTPQALAEIATIEGAAERGAELVRQLLAFARQQRLEPRVVALNAVIRGMLPILQRLVGSRIRVEAVLEQPDRRVRVDPGGLDQVLLNLAANARDAMPTGGTLHIATSHAVVVRENGEGPRSTPPGRWAILEVSDTGPGIPPDILPRLFEPFFTTRQAQGGSGLGLATVQGIVAQSGGHIHVSNREAGGACICIYLPRHEGEAEAEPAASAAPDPIAPRPVPGAPLLLVEDEMPLRRLAARILERAGHTVITADSAESALDLIAGGVEPSRLVSDVAMPGADGLELARRLRVRWPSLPVLLMSGYAPSTIGAELTREGIVFLAKPYTPAQLAAAVEGLH